MENVTENNVKEIKKNKAVGTVIDLDAADGTWFTFFNSHIKDDGDVEYDEPVEGAGRFCLRPINKFVEEYYANRKQQAEFVLNKKTRAMERVTYSKDMTPAEREVFQADMWDYTIVNFENLFDKNGNLIAVTKENKVKLMSIPAIDRFVSKCLKIMADDAVKQTESLNKNL